MQIFLRFASSIFLCKVEFKRGAAEPNRKDVKIYHLESYLLRNALMGEIESKIEKA